MWIADRVLLHAKDFIRLRRIAPHDIHAHLLYLISNAAKLDAKRPLNLVDVLELHNRVTDSSVDAQDTVLGHFVGNDGTKWHPLKQVVDFLKDTVRIFNVFVKSLDALLAKAQVFVDVAILVVASKQENLTRVLQFQSQKETDDLEALTSTIDVITEEDIICAVNITCFLGRPPNIEESHEVVIVTVKISEDLNGRFKVLDKHRLCCEHLRHLINELQNLLLLDVEGSHEWDCCLALPGCQQVLDEE